MKNQFILWIESYLFRPNALQKFICFLLLPFSFLYGFVMKIKRLSSKAESFDIPIISIGNLVVGGSGKTPFILSLAKFFKRPAVILRGYKRSSSGLYVVSDSGDIKVDLNTSGDEAMLYAKTLKNAVVIVSEDRKKAIKEAQKLDCDIVLLDDGFNKTTIKKIDILLYSDMKLDNCFTLPSGPFREFKKSEKYADLILYENKDFIKKTYISNPTQKMILVTAIANASRLDRHLPQDLIGKFIFADHHEFSKNELEKIIKESGASSLLVTRKDWVKMSEFGLNLSILELDLIINENVKNDIFKLIS